MKTQWIRSIGCILAVLILSGIMPLAAQDNAERYTTISGVVKDKLNKKKLEYVNVSIPGSSVGTVTNADGEFTLKIPESVQAKDIEASHVGYLNSRIPLKEENPTERIVWLTPYANLLSEILVRARDPRSIVEEALRKIPANYSPQSNMLTGFYRELAQKGRRYINISEAVIDIYKTPYNETAEHDRVQIYRGRRLLSQKQSDTLAVKLLGGPNMAIYMDIVKNPDCLLAQEDLLFYEIRMEDPTSIDDRSQYVISFRPRVKLSYPLCYGTLYIDKERLSFTRAEFNLSMDDKNKATQAILRKKPFGLRFKPVEVSYLISYKNLGGITYLSYIRNNIHFKCDWKRKLFSTNYTILSEMVVTDRKENNITAIPYKAAFKQNHVFSDKVDNFTSDNFWGGYNIIEPTESLEHAVNKLKKQQKQ